jgi:hypothetical protein
MAGGTVRGKSIIFLFMQATFRAAWLSLESPDK